MARYPERLARFHRGLGMLVSMSPITGYYPFGDLATTEHRVVLVDVSGGAGQCLVDILKAHPEFEPQQMVLQDRPEMIDVACANTELPSSVVKVAHDFFTPQRIQHAKAYYMRYIMHDYADDMAVHILQNLKMAMAADSKILICESVLPERVDETTILGPTIDIFMFTLGGKERTAKGFEKILKRAGLRLVKIWHASGAPVAIVEATIQ